MMHLTFANEPADRIDPAASYHCFLVDGSTKTQFAILSGEGVHKIMATTMMPRKIAFRKITNG